jgi:hypothetical protein
LQPLVVPAVQDAATTLSRRIMGAPGATSPAARG